VTAHVLERHGLIRGPRKADQNYIAATWVRSMSGVAGRAFGTRGGAVARDVDAVLDRDDTRALIRHAPGDMDRIMGWIVYVEGPAVPVTHYVYVRDKERGRGVAASLLYQSGVRRDVASIYTNRGPDTRFLLSAYPLAQYLSLKEFLA
jgi:GNAT superfamily N-acetyltransferase